MSLEALNASIAKWERNAKAKRPANYKTGVSDCPLCGLYMMPPDGRTCRDCPIFKITGKTGCADTPYEDAVSARSLWGSCTGLSIPVEMLIELRDAAHEAAREEVRFLKEVRAKIYPEAEQ